MDKRNPQRSAGNKLRPWLIKYNHYLILVVFIIISVILNPRFFRLENLTNLLKQNASVATVAIGELLVILTGGIDLSVGAMGGLFGIVVSLFLRNGLAWPLASLLTMVLGLFAGTVNGFLVANMGMEPFIATLGTMTVYKGISLLASRGRQVFFNCPGFLELGGGYLGWVPICALVVLVIAIIVELLLKHSIGGRILRAIGGNKEAVHLAGINSGLYQLAAYSFSGLFAAVAGIMMSSRLTLGSNVVGGGWELTAIASVMIGGGAFTAGLGTVQGTIVGVFILGLISNTMNLAGITIYWQDIVAGLIIILAVISSMKSTAKMKVEREAELRDSKSVEGLSGGA